MRKRFGGGGGSFSQPMRHVLRRRLDAFKHLNSSTIDEIVDHLRSTYPDYRRDKLAVLTRFVQQTLDSSPGKPLPKKQSRYPPSPPFLFADDDDDYVDGDGGRTASRKKPKRSADDDGEERLRQMEQVHLQRIQRSDQNGPSTSEESASGDESSSGSEEGEEDSDDGDGAVSTSEDAVYGEKLEPKVDLMKSMLRDSYKEANSAAAKVKSAAEKDKEKGTEKNLELELPDSREKVRMMSGIGGGGGGGKRLPVESKREAKGGSSSVADVEVKGNSEGPRFRDFGGMKKVLEELETEVLLPLYHPQIPRHLGVRPITGILFHGPPGCGKTKLAHAIANETRVPFYKISATEIVSGVSGASVPLQARVEHFLHPMADSNRTQTPTMAENEPIGPATPCPLSKALNTGFESPSPSPLAPSVARLWRPAAQRNLRNQWSKLAPLCQQWKSSSSAARSHATSLVNAYLSQTYIPTMELGVLSDMPDIRKKASWKLLKQQEGHRSKLLSSYKEMVGVVTQMVRISKSMRCYLKGGSASPVIQFSGCSEDKNDQGDGGGIPVFTFWSIAYFEKLADELVQMLVSELNLKRLLVVEFLSVSCESSMINKFDWKDEIYTGEFDDLSVCNLYSWETSEPVFPSLQVSKSDVPTARSNHQPNHEIMQVYLTTWLAEVNIDTHRMDEIFSAIGEEMHVNVS